MKYTIIPYTTKSGKNLVKEYIDELAKGGNQKEINKIYLFLDRLGTYGVEINSYFAHSIRKLDDTIYELRPGGTRIFFFSFINGEIILLHCYKKQGQKMPPKELEKAKNEREDYLRRIK